MATLLDTDVLLVNRADETYQMTFDELKQSVKNVLRDGIVLSGNTLPAFENSDLFLVNRGEITYKLTYAELKDSIVINIPPVLTNVNLVETTPGVDPRFTDQTFVASSTLSEDGIPNSTKTFDAYVQGALLQPLETSEIVGEEDSYEGKEYTGGSVTDQNGNYTTGSWDNVFDNPNSDPTLFVQANGSPQYFAASLYYLPTPITAYSTVTISGKTNYPAANGPRVVFICTSGAVPSIDLPSSQQLKTANITNAPAVITQIQLHTGGEQIGTPLSTLYSIEIDGVPFGDPLKILTFADDTNLEKFEVDDGVIDSNGNATGIFKSSSDESMTLRNPTGTWTANNGSYAIGPKVPVDNTRLYCKFNSNGDIIDLLDAPQSPPYTTQDIDPSLTFTFPSIFPSGYTPDEEIGEGSTLTVTVQAENESGTSGPRSATVQPEVFNDFTSPIESIGIVNETLQWVNTVGSAVIISDDGLDLAKAEGTSGGAQATGLVRTTGKYYFEIRVVTDVAVNQDRFDIGWGDITSINAYWLCNNLRFWGTQNGTSFTKITHNLPNNGTDYIMMCAIDYNNRKVWYGIDGNWYNNQNPSSGSNSYFKWDTSVENDTSIGMRITHSMGSLGCETFINPTPQYAPSGFLTVADYDQLVFETDKSFDKFAKEEPIYQLDRNAEGICAVPDNANRSIKLRASEGTWEVGQKCSAEVVLRSLTAEELEAQKLLFATYENRKMVNCGQQAQAKRIELASELLDAGYTAPEIADVYVNPLDPGAPIAIAGYYPLYVSEADANAAGDGTSHSHFFNSVTYYMPNGITYYHGSYNSESGGY